MTKIDIKRTSPIENTFRVAKVRGMFDMEREESVFELNADIDLDAKPWLIGAIVGASGSGKSTIARELWGDDVNISGDFDWQKPSLVDDFPKDMGAEEITSLLVSVGFSSSPAWLRPYRVLSTGQQFRADLARALTQPSTTQRPVVFDEFTSTVDRTVAKAVSVSVSKHVRRSEQPFVAVTCHKDIVDWLQPDWVFDTDAGTFSWRSVQPRPEIGLCLREGSREAWPLFREHHYMSHELSKSSRVFLAYVTIDGVERLAGFTAILPAIGMTGWWRGHRTVVLPDFQGLGIGSAMGELIGETLWTRERKRYRSVTLAPAMINHRKHSPAWRLSMAPGRKAPIGKTSSIKSKKSKLQSSASRLTTSWVYLPTELR